MRGMVIVRSETIATTKKPISDLKVDHLIGAPLAFASREYAEKAWKRFEDIPALQTSEVRCVRGRVAAIDCEKKIATISELPSNRQLEESYDYFVAATGLSREWPSAPQALTRDEYLFEAKKHIKMVENSHDKVVVIGGG